MNSRTEIGNLLVSLIEDASMLLETRSRDVAFVCMMLHELKRARAKHPNSDHMLVALGEETGEVFKAMMDESLERVACEASQVAVCALRMVSEGDRTLDTLRELKGLEPVAK